MCYFFFFPHFFSPQFATFGALEYFSYLNNSINNCSSLNSASPHRVMFSVTGEVDLTYPCRCRHSQNGGCHRSASRRGSAAFFAWSVWRVQCEFIYEGNGSNRRTFWCLLQIVFPPFCNSACPHTPQAFTLSDLLRWDSRALSNFSA